MTHVCFAGKSTLLKILTSELQPVLGAVRPHPHLRISKFTQHFIDVLDLSMSPLDYFMFLWPDVTREDARKFLGRFGCSGQVQTQPMGQLSDGQKSRVVFAKIAKEVPHILFLDEPTNHLDMESIDSLAKAINSFHGGLVLVSHDMRLISQVAREIWMCDNHTVTKYAGEIDDFKMKIRRQMQKDNLIDADRTGGSVAALAPPVTSTTIVPLAPVVAKKETQEEAILKARLELAELAIAKQRARKAAESGESTEKGDAEADGDEGAEKDGVDDEEAARKAAIKAKRRQEKEAIAAREKLEEEERQKRREEKLKEMEV